jgi:predicted transcriptional regulator
MKPPVLKAETQTGTDTYYLKSEDGKMMLRITDNTWTSISIYRLNKNEWQVINNVQALEKVSHDTLAHHTANMVMATRKEFNRHVMKASNCLLASYNLTPCII